MLGVGLFFRRRHAWIDEYFVGGGTTVFFNVIDIETAVDPIFFGLGISGTVLVVLSLWFPKARS